METVVSMPLNLYFMTVIMIIVDDIDPVHVNIHL